MITNRFVLQISIILSNKNNKYFYLQNLITELSKSSLDLSIDEKNKFDEYPNFFYILRLKELIRYVYDKIEKEIKEKNLEKILEEIKVNKPLVQSDAEKLGMLIYY